LDNESLLEQFDEIENRVEKLIEARRKLETANEELTRRVGRLEAELQSRNEEEDRLSETKALIKTKIDNLMERLEGFTEADQDNA
jgi:predicted nuclease with TOPRIM domain